MSSLLAEGFERPEHAWTNHEDTMYHDRWYASDGLNASPELVGFLHATWTFNRAMVWNHDPRRGTLLCYSASPDLQLTGQFAVSDWHTGPANRLTAQDDTLRFEKRSARHRDAAVLPALQFDTRQHPRLRITVSAADADWQVCVGIKGRGGPPLLATEWHSGPGELELDLDAALPARGYTTAFAELNFAVGVWTEECGRAAAVEFDLALLGRPATVASLPVVRTLGEPVPVTAVVLNAGAKRMTAEDGVTLDAHARGQRVAIAEVDGWWTGTLDGLPAGEHEVTLTATGIEAAPTTLMVRVVEGRYCSYDAQHARILDDQGHAIGPLTGSYQGTFRFRDVGTADERLVATLEDWEQWDRAAPPGERLHYWEAMTESELDERFAYLARCGWDLVHLHSNWGQWEHLDVGGHLAPRGAEQLALYVRVAARHGLRVMQSLSSYPYGYERTRTGRFVTGTPPDRRYREHGFRDRDWYVPDTAFTDLFHDYLDEFLTVFAHEDALFSVSASGEGDHMVGPARVNDTHRFWRRRDARHLFVCEPIFQLHSLPGGHTEGYEPALRGTRTYFIGDDLASEVDLGIDMKLMRMGAIYLAEGSWATPAPHAALHAALGDDEGTLSNWTGTARYRLRVRDTLYLGLINRIPLLVTWDEYVSEDEHAVLARVRDEIDWEIGWRRPRVVVRVDDESVAGEGRRRLGELERALSAQGVDYEMVVGDADLADDAHVLDARRGTAAAEPEAAAAQLPQSVLDEVVLRPSAGWCAASAAAADGSVALCYVYNCAGHETVVQYLAGRHHRSPRPADLSLERPVGAGRSSYVIHDLVTREVSASGVVDGGERIELGVCDHDVLVVLRAAA